MKHERSIFELLRTAITLHAGIMSRRAVVILYWMLFLDDREQVFWSKAVDSNAG